MEWINRFIDELQWFPSWWNILWLVTYVLAIVSIPSVLLERRGQPQIAISWLLVLFSLPFVGLLLWWAVGRKHLRRKKLRRRRARARMTHSLSRLRDDLTEPTRAKERPSPIPGLPREDAQWIFPPTKDNCVQLLVDADEAYPAIEQAIRQARHHVHVLFYIWNDDHAGRRFRDLLVDKARQGVEVRLLCDAFGAPAVGARLMDPLREAGGRVALFLPTRLFVWRLAMNFRNHRKIVLADARVGIIGGLNIGDEYTTGWHDTAVQIEGPAVDQLQEVFVDDWYFATGEEVTSGAYFGRWRAGRVHAGDSASAGHGQDVGTPPFSFGEGHVCDAICDIVASGPHTQQNRMQDAFFLAITQAAARVWITMPYFIPDESLLMALRTAVYRGVDVRLLLPEKIDQPVVRLAARSYYPELLRCGVRIYEYSPAVLHGKTVLVDDELSVIGSANMDTRSFKMNFELSGFIRSRSLARQMADLFERDLADSREIDLREMEKRSRREKLIESAAHLLSPLI